MSLSGIPTINSFEEAVRTVAELTDKNALLTQEVEWLREQLRLQKLRQFGSLSEKTPLGQEALDLFNEAEVVADSGSGEPAVEEVHYSRPKNKRNREQLLRDLPCETIEYRLPEDEQVCPCCAGSLHEIGKESTYTVDIVPLRFIVKNHVQFKYGCRTCAKDPEAKTPVIEATKPRTAFPGSLASPSLVSYIVCQKYLEGLPLYRQEQAFARTGFEISRQSMANWVIAASLVLEPLFDRMKVLLLLHDILYSDDTTLQVLHEEDRKPETKSHFWLYRTGRYPTQGAIVLYEYERHRSQAVVQDFLAGFKGFLLTDGHNCFDKLPEGVTNAGCWAHARRHFTDALAVLPKQLITEKKRKPTYADFGKEFCDKLYRIERELHDLSADERHAARLLRSAPLLTQFRAWLEANVSALTPTSLAGKAMRYCLNQWSELIVFLQDGRLEIDNNRSERSIKPFVIGRKNWLFSNTPSGADASAVIYSLVESAKENGLNPFNYLTHLFEKLPPSGTGEKVSPDLLDDLMPWSESLPANCRMPTKAKSPSTPGK